MDGNEPIMSNGGGGPNVFESLFGKEPTTDVVRAKSFVLTDDDGHTRARLGFGQQGEPRLVMAGQGGAALSLSVTPNEEAAITFIDAAGMPKMIAVASETMAAIQLLNAQGDARFLIGYMKQHDQAFLVIRDATGKTLFQAPAD